MTDKDAGIIIDGNDVDDLCMAVINMAFQRGMPEILVGSEAQFEKGDKERAIDEDIEFFGTDLGDLANLAQLWLTNNIAPTGHEFVCKTTGFYLKVKEENADKQLLDMLIKSGGFISY